MKNSLFQTLAIIALASALSASPQSLIAEARGETISPVRGLEMLRHSMSGVNDFTAEITQEKQISLMKKKMKAGGIIRFRKPDTFFMELYPPYPSRMLMNDTAVSMFFPADGVRQKMVLPRGESLKRWFTLLDKPVTSIPEGVTMSAEKNGKNITLQISPAGRGNVKNLRVTFLENSRISRLAIEEKNGDSTVINIRNMRINQGLTERDFRLE